MPPRKKFLLRIDPGLYRDLETWAQQEFRSVNGQIEYVLKEALVRRKRAAAPPPHEKAPTPSEPPASAGG